MNGKVRMSEQMVPEGAHRPIRWVSNRVSTGARHVIADFEMVDTSGETPWSRLRS
jgi:hypothetical protein